MATDSERNRLQEVLQGLYSPWRAWLRARHGSLSARHDDILQEAAADLLEYALRDGVGSHSDEELSKIGFAILKRRVADEFRSLATKRTGEISDTLPADESPSSDPEHVLHYAKLLRAVIGILGQLDKPSRDLILRSELSVGLPDVPLTDAQRQRLSRLRTDLRRRLLDDYNIDIRMLLKD